MELRNVLLEVDGRAAEVDFGGDDGEVRALAAATTERAARAEPLMALLTLALPSEDAAGLDELAREEPGSLLTCVSLGLGAGAGTGDEGALRGIESAMFLHAMGKAST